MSLPGIALAALLCGCEASSGPPLPEPVVRESTRHYTLRGATIEQLERQIGMRGVPHPSGLRMAAGTSWYVEWTYPYSKAFGVCGTGPITTTITITTRLPKWNPPPDVSNEMIARWNAYLAALQLHEKGHRDIGVQAARAVAKQLATLAPQRSCEQMEQVADVEAERVIAEARSVELRYDQSTNHGATQGARLR